MSVFMDLRDDEMGGDETYFLKVVFPFDTKTHDKNVVVTPSISGTDFDILKVQNREEDVV